MNAEKELQLQSRSGMIVQSLEIAKVLGHIVE